MTRRFERGDHALFVDRKARRYLVTLEEGAEFHTHSGFVSHRDVIGQEEGLVVRTASGARYTVVRPTITDFVLKMPRGAQVIYPKDLAQILVLADIFPGARVLEAGVGSGALSMTLVRAGAHVTGYELREDFANGARKNVKAFLGNEMTGSYDVRVRDVYEGIEECNLDRIVLDLPEPWRVVKHAVEALRPGGLLVSYVPSIVQVTALRELLDGSPFGMVETSETLVRTWHIEGAAVRPDHRMVAHTGFLTVARLLADQPSARSAPGE